MEPITVSLKEDRGLARKGEFLCFGVPLAQSLCYSVHGFVLHNSHTGEKMNFQLRPLAYWSDGAFRWVELSIALDMEPWQELTLTLLYECGIDDTSVQLPSPSVQMEEDGVDLTVCTGPLTVGVRKDDLQWWVEQRFENTEANLSHRIVVTDDEGQRGHVTLDGSWSVYEHSNFKLTLASQGAWYKTDGSLLTRFDCVLQFFASSDLVFLEIRVHNPSRARHSGGLWDLGDPGSIHFRSLDILVEHPSSVEARIQPEVHSRPLTACSGDSVHVFQDSSGGEHWDSRNHLDAEGRATVRFRGYKAFVGKEIFAAGERATPIVSLAGPSGGVQASVKQFWQNFPTALGIQGDTLTIGLFPDGSAGPYELQGGERKTLGAYLSYSDDADALLWTQDPLVPVVESRNYELARAFPWFTASQEPGPLDVLIQKGLHGPENFFAKRETIDEYGWRNFGDVFADHETLYQNPGEEPLISHYNNQYDAIYGFARQFALTGDRRWYELMDDLARHVTDIDIYHTEEDRAEYNGGLFWHTDHYLDAHTATHRTFTRHNTTSSTPGQTGGGPASEHCYTTGLLYHYYLTGTEASRNAVLQLSRWMIAAHEGQGGFLEQLLALRKHEVPRLKQMLRGERIMPHRYPFTRGTGNYLNALLDAWLLEPSGPWLTQAESVIRDTIHPDDNIDQRDLLNVETGWSYLILLASLGRYLILKEEAGEEDETYRYALASFLRYAAWMEANERPFLTDPEQLEFANDTWVAQDVRKAMLMFQAASYDTSDADAYHSKGREWLSYVCDRLGNSPEAGYARIQIILLQNYGPHHLAPATKAIPHDLDLAVAGQQPVLTWTRLIARMAGRLTRGLRTFNPGRERAWLKARLDRT